MRRLLLLACVACATPIAPRIAIDAPRCPPSDPSLYARVYANAWDDVAALQRDLDAACPSADVLEMRAMVALLTGDDQAAFFNVARAAADASSPLVDLHLFMASGFDLGRARAESFRKLAEDLADKHPRARFIDASLRARFDDMSGAQKTFAKLAYATEWHVIGPFDNDEGKGFRAHYPPEDGVKLDATYPGKLLPVSWRKKTANIDGTLRFNDMIAPADHATLYAVTRITADGTLRLAVHGALQVFIDGKQVFSEEHLEGSRGDNVVIPFSGTADVLVKVSAKSGGRFSLRAAEREEPLPKLDLLHRSFIAQRDGRIEERLPPLAQYVQESPDNPLAIYFAALAHADKGELGTAIDLIERGVKRYGRLAEMVAQRARFFGAKKQLERQLEALELARAQKAGPSIMRNLAQAYAARGWHIDRARVLQAVLDGEPDLAPVLADLGDAMRDRGYNDAADKLFARAAELEPGRNFRHEQPLATLDRHGALDLALRKIHAMQAREPYAPSLLIREADLLRRSGMRVEAVDRLLAAIKLNPDASTPYARLADLASEAGDEKEAQAFLLDAQKRDPKNVWIADRLAFLRHDRAEGADPLLLSADAIADLAKKEVAPQPGAHVLDLLDEGVCDVKRDGSERCVITEISRVLDTSGRDMLTQLRLRGGGSNKVLIATAYAPNGEATEAASTNDGSVRFRQLDVGSTVVLRYEHNAPPGRFLPNHYAAQWYFSAPGRQLERSRWVLKLDPKTPLTITARGNVTQKKEERDGKTVYEFVADKQAPIVPEPAMPPLDDVAVIVAVSTVPGWDDYVRWERALLAEAYRKTPEIEALAKKLTAGTKTPGEKIDRLYRFTAEEIRYQQEYETNIAGVKPHACPIVVERGYGDCKDKALLFIALAKSLGIDVHFALVRTQSAGKIARDVPNQQFNHAIVYVPSQQRFIDPTVDALDVGNLRADDQGTTSLVLDVESGKYQFIDIPYDSPELQLQTHALDLTIKDDLSAVAKDTITIRGSGASQLRTLSRNRESAEKVMQSLAGGLFSSSTLQTVTWPDKEDITKPLETTMVIDATRSVREIDGAYRVRLPGLPPVAQVARLRSRTYPLVLGPPELIRFDQKVSLPKGAKITHVPRDVSLEGPCLKLTRKGEKKAEGLALTTTVERRCAQIAASDFEAFRGLLLSAIERLEEDLEFKR